MPNVSNNDVTSIVHSLKNSSPGWDGLQAFVAKQCAIQKLSNYRPIML